MNFDQLDFAVYCMERNEKAEKEGNTVYGV